MTKVTDAELGRATKSIVELMTRMTNGSVDTRIAVQAVQALFRDYSYCFLVNLDEGIINGQTTMGELVDGSEYDEVSDNVRFEQLSEIARPVQSEQMVHLFDPFHYGFTKLRQTSHLHLSSKELQQIFEEEGLKFADPWTTLTLAYKRRNLLANTMIETFGQFPDGYCFVLRVGIGHCNRANSVATYHVQRLYREYYQVPITRNEYLATVRTKPVKTVF